MEEKIFTFDKRHTYTVIFSVAIYGACIVFLTLETILSGISIYGGGLSDFWNKLLFNRSNNSSFMLLIYILLNAYCMMGTAKNLLIHSRVRKCCLRISEDTISGFAFGKSQTWRDGKAFSLAKDAIASVGKTDSRLVGNSMITTVVINTDGRSYYLPGLEDAEEAKKQLE